MAFDSMELEPFMVNVSSKLNMNTNALDQVPLLKLDTCKDLPSTCNRGPEESCICSVSLECGIGQPFAQFRFFPDQARTSPLAFLQICKELKQKCYGDGMDKVCYVDRHGAACTLSEDSIHDALNFLNDAEVPRLTLVFESSATSDLHTMNLLRMKAVQDVFWQCAPPLARDLVWQFLRNPLELLIAYDCGDRGQLDIISLQSGVSKRQVEYNCVNANFADQRSIFKGPTIASSATAGFLAQYSTECFADGFQVAKLGPLAGGFGMKRIHSFWWHLEPVSNEVHLQKHPMGLQPLHANDDPFHEIIIQRSPSGLLFAAGIVASSVQNSWAAALSKKADGVAVINVYDIVSGACRMSLDLDIADGIRGLTEVSLVTMSSWLLSVRQNQQHAEPKTEIQVFHIGEKEEYHQYPCRIFAARMHSISMLTDTIAAIEDLDPRGSHEGDVVLFHVGSKHGLDALPYHRLHGRFRAVALSNEHIVVYTWQYRPIGAEDPGCLMVWTRQAPSQCVWHSGTLAPHPNPFMSDKKKSDTRYFITFAVKLPGHAPLVEDLVPKVSSGEEELKSPVLLPTASISNPSETAAAVVDPIRQISPEEAEETANQLWASGVEALSQGNRLDFEEDSTEGGSTNIAAGAPLVLLAFSRRPEELKSALLESELATHLVNIGVDVRPAWARGALVLAAGIEQDNVAEVPWTWNVAVHEAHEKEIWDALKKLPYNIRPRLKPSIGRAVAPEGDAFFAQSSFGLASEASFASSSTSDFNGVDLSNDVVDILVERTFVHYPPEPLASVRSMPHTV